MFGAQCPLANDSFPGGGSPLSPAPDTVFDTRELTPAFAELKKNGVMHGERKVELRLRRLKSFSVLLTHWQFCLR